MLGTSSYKPGHIQLLALLQNEKRSNLSYIWVFNNLTKKLTGHVQELINAVPRGMPMVVENMTMGLTYCLGILCVQPQARIMCASLYRVFLFFLE